MKEAVKGIIKKVTLEMVYEIVDQRTTEIKDDLNRRFQEANEKMRDLKEDTNRRFQEVNQKIEDLKGDTNRRFQEVHETLNEIKDELRELRAEMRHINQRLDTIFTFFLTGKAHLPGKQSE